MSVNNNPSSGSQQPVVVESSSSGWIFAVIILLVVLAGGFYLWTKYYGAPAPTEEQPGTTINVTLPTGDTNGGVEPSPAQ